MLFKRPASFSCYYDSSFDVQSHLETAVSCVNIWIVLNIIFTSNRNTLENILSGL